MPNKMLTDKELFKAIVEDAWLGLGDTSKINIVNPFDYKTDADKDNPAKFVLRLMRNPDNFYFTCKHLLNIEIHPFQAVILKELWTKKYPMLIAARGGSKSFNLGLYAILRAALCSNQKVLLIGSGFRQSKIIFEYCENFFNNSPILQDIFSNSGDGIKHENDRYIMRLGSSSITAIPIGAGGDKIRGLRATSILIDEFHTQNPEILETVIFGFGSVLANPIEKVKRAAGIEKLKELGEWTIEDESQESSLNDGNQIVISGTASFSFNHFHKYWKKQRDIILSKGNKEKLEEIFAGEVPEKFSHKDYSIIRLPVELLPLNYMDEKHVARSKATIHTGIYETEYGAVFSSDTIGFFKRSLIESCVTTQPVSLLSGDIQFSLQTKGDMSKQHVFGIDPASEVDNFAINIIEINDDHRRVVYQWTMTRALFKERMNKGLINQQDFYGYCARKIRDLMIDFPCCAIAIDSQGGGRAVLEAINDTTKMKPNEKQLWPVIDKEKPQDTDMLAGLHIIHIINFAKHEWVQEANHGLRKDMEDKAILFPFYDDLNISFATEEDLRFKRYYDTLEDLVFEMEELKNELTTIIHTQLPNSGRDRWDTPEIKLGTNKKGRLRKDRYSSLLMSNMVARQMERAMPAFSISSGGGQSITFINKKNKNREDLYGGRSDFAEAIGYGDFLKIIRR